MAAQDAGPQPKERRHKRVTTREVTATIGVARGALVYTVANLSIGGALVTGAAPLARGETFDIELKLKGTRAVQVRGTVVHVRTEGIGIAFESFTADQTQALEKLIADGEAKNALPPPLPTSRVRTDELPAVVPRPDDAFATEHDPRPPRSGSPDERAEYLRVLIKNRDEALKKGRAALQGIVAEADQLRAHATRLKTRLDAVTNQHALTEVALAAARAETEKEREGRLKERETASEQLEQEQRRTLEAIAAVSGLEASMRRHENQAKHALEEAENAKKEAEAALHDASNVRRAREELMQANRKAIETQTTLQKERTARQTAETQVSQLRGTEQALTAEVERLQAQLAQAADIAPLTEHNAQLREEVEQLRRQLAAAGDTEAVAAENAALKEEVERLRAQPASGVADEENARLKGEAQRLKAKLVNAEAALEKMMSRGSKPVRR